LSFCCLLLFASVIWTPEIRHYHVATKTVGAEIADRGRTNPADEVLDEMRAHRLLERGWQSDAQLVATAEKLRKGSAEIPGLPPIGIALPFDAADLDKGTDQWQLQFCGLIVPEIFIDAYRVTGREEFYEMARDVILAWGKFEAGAWLDRGFLWNDHAVASRVRTLADFWSIYRRRSDYRSDVASQIWTFAARTGALLAKSDQFTFATNHGVMQNIGLLQLCIGFPSLPKAEEYKREALERLKDQIAFFVSSEGAVLEHSAGYQRFDLFLFGLVLRYTTVLHLDVPAEWNQKYERAKEFYLQMRRPDGSLPPYGDTGIPTNPAAVSVTYPNERGQFVPLTAIDAAFHPRPIEIYPASGYAVIWDGLKSGGASQDLSQTVLAWSYYPGHGHKHADELSVLLWAEGLQLWTNTGYWPYGDPDRANAECWGGSNAPHFRGESCNSNRTAALTSSIQSSELSAVEMERRSEGGKIRRLMVHLCPSVWVIVDTGSDATEGSLETAWTMAPRIAVKRGASSAYVLSSNEMKGQLRAYLLGPESMKIRSVRGIRDPFAGWVAWGGRPVAANALIVDQPAAGAWAMTIWVLDKAAGAPRTDGDAALEWSNSRFWKVRVPGANGSWMAKRDGDKISAGLNVSVASLSMGTLKPTPASVETEIASLHEAFEVAAARYPRFRNLVRYRIRASVLGIAFFLLQILLLPAYGRLGGTHIFVLRVLTLVAWAVLCIAVPISYLRVS
jgi:hypothetical protein